jgi:hypothetical protein
VLTRGELQECFNTDGFLFHDTRNRCIRSVEVGMILQDTVGTSRVVLKSSFGREVVKSGLATWDVTPR